MQAPAIPRNEQQRMNALRSLHVLDTLPEERFDRITRIASRLFDVPVALVSLVDDERQWFKSTCGIDVEQTPREISFCGHAILNDEILLVKDALEDARFQDNPLVVKDPNIRFYAGCPLRLPEGEKVGTLCLIDKEPRTMSDEEQQLLRDLAAVVQQELAMHRTSTIDELTGLENLRGFKLLCEDRLRLCQRLGSPVSLAIFDLVNFKAINEQLGHQEGDFALRSFAQILRESLRNSDVIARLGGDEFAVLLSGMDQQYMTETLARIEYRVRTFNRSHRKHQLDFAVGISSVEGGQDYPDLATLHRRADTNLRQQIHNSQLQDGRKGA